jgi:hypothetical protein
MSDFTVSFLMAPLLALAFGLGMFWLTGWLDRRERRRQHHAAE